MGESTLGECPCGMPAMGSVNLHLYCGQIDCINRALKQTLTPVKDAKKKAGISPTKEA